jgi:hypothetical protein
VDVSWSVGGALAAGFASGTKQPPEDKRHVFIMAWAACAERHMAGELLATSQINDLVYQQLIMDIDLLDARYAPPPSS